MNVSGSETRAVSNSNCCVTLSNLHNLSVLLLLILIHFYCSGRLRGFCELTLAESFVFPTGGNGSVTKGEDKYSLIIRKSLRLPPQWEET